MANDMPDEKIPHMMRQHQPLLYVELLRRQTELLLLLMPRIGHDGDTNEGDEDAGQRHQSARLLNRNRNWPCMNGGMSVPMTSVVPMAIPIPSDIPR